VDQCIFNVFLTDQEDGGSKWARWTCFAISNKKSIL